MGRALGSDLSRIGQIRRPRDLLEAILLPNATIARDYDCYIVETTDGQSYTGLVKSDTSDGLRLIDLAWRRKEHSPRAHRGQEPMPTSLIPTGLEQAFTEQQLLDMVAGLESLK